MLRYATYTPRKAHGSAVCSLPNRLIITPPSKSVSTPWLLTGSVSLRLSSVVSYSELCRGMVLPSDGVGAVPVSPYRLNNHSIIYKYTKRESL